MAFQSVHCTLNSYKPWTLLYPGQDLMTVFWILAILKGEREPSGGKSEDIYGSQFPRMTSEIGAFLPAKAPWGPSSLV